MTAGLPPLLNKSALLKLGWTPTLITAILVKPDQVQRRAKGIYKWVEHLYSRDRVVEAMDKDPRFLKLAAKRIERKNAEEQRKAERWARFATWRDALPEACDELFILNRYAKDRDCSSFSQVEIYRLKNEFIRLLYERGFSTAAYIDRLFLEVQLCRECGGAGDLCVRCNGSGIWKTAKTLEFWCFRFAVGRKEYCWHQPVHLVSFTPVAALPPQQMDAAVLRAERPARVSSRKLAEGLELLRWVIQKAGADNPPVVDEEVKSAVGFPPFDGLQTAGAATCLLF